MLNYMIVLQARLNDVDYLQISEYFLYLLKVDIQEASGDDPDGADTKPPPCWHTGHTHTHTHSWIKAKLTKLSLLLLRLLFHYSMNNRW